MSGTVGLAREHQKLIFTPESARGHSKEAVPVATERARSYCKSSKPQKDVGQTRGSRASDFDKTCGRAQLQRNTKKSTDAPQHIRGCGFTMSNPSRPCQRHLGTTTTD